LCCQLILLKRVVLIINNGKKVVMVSGCLLGIPCRFDGTSREVPELRSILADYQLISFCPEAAGGMKSPRLPAEIQGGDGAGVLTGSAKVVNRIGEDHTKEFLMGAEAVGKLVQKYHPDFVVLKAKSPSCGVGQIYDGTFTGTLREGDGVTAALLRNAGVKVYSDIELKKIEFGNN
jgi:uncharacterized protein YbbK (DUF523 family)